MRSLSNYAIAPQDSKLFGYTIDLIPYIDRIFDGKFGRVEIRRRDLAADEEFPAETLSEDLWWALNPLGRAVWHRMLCRLHGKGMMMGSKPLPPATVFLSYSHLDWPRVEPLLQAFEVWEWIVASDRDDLNMGEGWRDKIQPRVDGAYTLLVTWSKTSVQSGPVLDEVQWALKKNNGLKFFPVLVEEGTKPPPHLWTDEGVDLSQWKGDPKDPLFERVRVAVQNPWTLDNGMPLIRDIKVMKTIGGFVKPPEVQVEPPV